MLPLEYYLGGAVAVILLVLLVSAVTGKNKQTTRRVAVRENSTNGELSRQVARAADALEALLAYLKASGVPSGAPMQQRATSQASSHASAATVQPPAAAASSAGEPTATETSAQSTEQKPRHIKLSMFGR